MDKKKDSNIDKPKSKKASKESKEEVKSNGLPENVDFKKFLGCGG